MKWFVRITKKENLGNLENLGNVLDDDEMIMIMIMIFRVKKWEHITTFNDILIFMT